MFHYKGCFLIVSFILLSFLVYNDQAECGERTSQNLLNERFAAAIKKKEKQKDPWLGEDKIQHFFASAFITGFGFLIMREPLDSSKNNSIYFGSGVSISLGIGKEIYDWRSKKGHASYKDLIADILGIGCAVLIIKII
ncbi:MAG: hypothetical protein ACE5HI_11870 [bacterium]